LGWREICESFHYVDVISDPQMDSLPLAASGRSAGNDNLGVNRAGVTAWAGVEDNEPLAAMNRFF